MLKKLLKVASILMVFSTLWGGLQASAQNRAISGKVVDANGEPIIGAGVVQVGTTNGATTDLDGVFSLRVAPGTSLEVSCIGYVTRRVSAAENMTIILQDDSEMLEETVVVGYGVQRKKLVTGSTVSVSGDKLASTHAVDAFGALQSQAAGVNIVQNSGQPGES